MKRKASDKEKTTKKRTAADKKRAKSKKKEETVKKVAEKSPSQKEIMEMMAPQCTVEGVNKLEEKKEPKKKSEFKGKIEFKTNRIKEEWKELDVRNKPLKDLLIDINDYCEKKYKKSIVLTMILRHQTEQDEIYANNPRYKKKKFKSPHQFWAACDIRSRIFTSEEVAGLVEYVNNKYNSNNFFKWTALNHTVGLGWHFHVQYTKK